MAMPASEDTIDGYRKVVNKTRPKGKKVSAQNVVDLFDEDKRRKRRLTKNDRENLVLEFRLKARKLARSILRRWHARLDLQEVDSVVDLSLCEAVRRFDPARGASFMTFLYYHLRGNLIRAVSAAASAHAVPSGENEAEQTAKTKYSRGINAIEIAEALCNHEHLLPDEILLKKELVDLSSAACTKLDTLEQEVIYRIYIQEQQLIDIAHSLGYSRCHISRVKKKALETLQEEMTNSIGADEEEEQTVATTVGSRGRERRKVHRRRPRSQKARKSKAASGGSGKLAAVA